MTGLEASNRFVRHILKSLNFSTSFQPLLEFAGIKGRVMEREKELAPARIALLIDGENVAAQHFPAVLEQVGKLGRAVVRRLFGISKDWEVVARANALKVEWQASGGRGKNTVDIAMAVHAMDIVHRGLADAICLVSSDCDFQPLAIHLREAGVTVYGMGEDKTDGSLREAYTQFHVLAKPSVPAVEPPAKPAAAPVPTKPNATRLVPTAEAPKRSLFQRRGRCHQETNA